MATIAENIQTLRSIKSDIKNAITNKGGSVGNDFKTYAQAITNLPSGGGGGGTENEDALVTRTISVYSNDRVSVVGKGAFFYCQSLTSVNLPNCLSLGSNAFAFCEKLTYFSLPLCENIDTYAFSDCTTLKSIDLPNCKFVGYGGFRNCYSLTNISLPNCSYVSNNGFDACSNLISINLPLCKNIAFGLFSKCLKLTYVSLPLCENIEAYAFSSCYTLPSIDFPNCKIINNYAFNYCSALSLINLPLCSYIGKEAFKNCINLTQVYLNSVSTVTTISSNTFYSCQKLTSVYVPSSLVDAFKTAQYWSSISDKIVAYREPTDPSEPIQYPPLIYSAKSAGSTITVNGETVTLEQGDNITLDYPNEITSVKATNNTALTYIQIPNTVTSIEDNAFTGCAALTDFNFNGTMEQWGAITLGTDWNKDAGFTVVHCTDGDVTLEEPIQPIQPNNLVYSAKSAGSKIKVNGQSVTLEQGDNITLDYPNEITSVKATSNTALTYIQIPNTVTSIESATFRGCSSLASVNIPDTVRSIGDSAFVNTSLTSITIPDGVTSIERNAFNGCGSLVSINIPEGITSISGFIFGMCTSLTSISIPNSVTSIGEYSFQLCSSLASITIPENVKSIGDNAFEGCGALTDFNYNGTKAQWGAITLGNNWHNNAAFTVVHCTDGDVTL